ncbi:hypothetical protein VP395_09685 [Mariniflexile soesokkakense]|uniref:Uncharacterized protein n=1 Tax=Mariniflexile soesokkakense TaxID=1343160 RepID=A0ABV0AAV9_9FLAO
MTNRRKLTDIHKKRLKILEPQLVKAINEKNLKEASNVISDLQYMLKPIGQITKLIQYKNWLFELALDLENYSLAEQGFIGNRKLVNKNTRIYLEATTLLAICYLRTNEYEKSKPLISEVLRNDKVIKTERTRQIFKKTIIERFDEEVSLYSIREGFIPKFDIDQIQNEAGIFVATKTEEDIYKYLGSSVPQKTKNLLFDIDNFSKNQLSYEERKFLPSPTELINNESTGKTLFSSLKRVIYNSICDPNSEIYKAWYSNGLSVVLDKKYIAGAVVASLTSLGIGLKALAVSAVALIIRFGLDVYCEHYKPTGIMESRKL